MRPRLGMFMLFGRTPSAAPLQPHHRKKWRNSATTDGLVSDCTIWLQRVAEKPGTPKAQGREPGKPQKNAPLREFRTAPPRIWPAGRRAIDGSTEPISRACAND